MYREASPSTPDAIAPVTVDELEPNQLYAVLTYKGELADWNWAFFVANPAVRPLGSSGTFFHVARVGSPESWKYVQEEKDVISAPLAVAIFQLADVGFLGDYEDIVGPDSLTPMFKTIKIPSAGSIASADFNTRTWFLDAIAVLHDCGVVTCDDGWLLEREVRKSTFQAMDKFMESKGWTGYSAEHCK